MGCKSSINAICNKYIIIVLADLQAAEERLSRLQVEHQSLLQCIWQGLGGRGEWKECAIKDRIRDIMTQNQELLVVCI